MNVLWQHAKAGSGRKHAARWSIAAVLLFSGCRARREPWERIPASYRGEVTWASYQAEKSGPSGGPQGLYRFLVERSSESGAVPQAAVFLDSATRVIGRGKGTGHRLGERARFFVRVWFRDPPRLTEFEMRGTADVIVIDSVIPWAVPERDKGSVGLQTLTDPAASAATRKSRRSLPVVK